MKIYIRLQITLLHLLVGILLLPSILVSIIIYPLFGVWAMDLIDWVDRKTTELNLKLHRL